MLWNHHKRRIVSYFGISSFPGRWREGGLKEAVGWGVLLGNVWITGGFQVLGRSLSGGCEGAGEGDEGVDEEDDSGDTISGVLMTDDWLGGALSTRFIGTILSFWDVCNNNNLLSLTSLCINAVCAQIVQMLLRMSLSRFLSDQLAS